VTPDGPLSLRYAWVGHRLLRAGLAFTRVAVGRSEPQTRDAASMADRRRKPAKGHRTEIPRAQKPKKAPESKKTYHTPPTHSNFLALLRLSPSPYKKQ